MVRQSQNYFAAAVSAAVLNAAAVAAFVLFTLLSSVNGFPLQDLLGSDDPVAAPTSSTSTGSNDAGDLSSDAFRRGAGVTTSRSGDPRAGANRPDTSTQIPGRPSPGPNSSVPGGGPGGTPTPGGPGGSATGGGSGLPGIPGLPGPSQPSPTSQLPPAVQQVGGAVGGAVSNLPPTANNTVNNTVDTADSALGGGLSSTGVSQTVNGASNAVLGPNSPVGQTAGAVGGALQGQGQSSGGSGGGLDLGLGG